MMRRLLVIATVPLLCAALAGAPRDAPRRAQAKPTAPVAPAPKPAVPAALAAPRDWSKRLEALDPARARSYFDLAEEVADGATTSTERELARTLFGLAGTLDPTLARSSALAIASLVEDFRLKRKLSALASLLDAEAGTNAADAVRLRIAPAAALKLSEAFSQFRRGQGSRALTLVKSADVEALLEEFGAGTPGGAARFKEDCKTFKGGARPELGREERQAMLAIEESLLAASAEDRNRGWSSVLLETGGRPLLEVDAARLDEAFNVDASTPYWRGAKWVKAP